MKITIDTDEFTRRLSLLAGEAARRVRDASERAAPVAEEALKRASAHADSLKQKFTEVRHRVEERAAGRTGRGGATSSDGAATSQSASSASSASSPSRAEEKSGSAAASSPEKDSGTKPESRSRHSPGSRDSQKHSRSNSAHSSENSGVSSSGTADSAGFSGSENSEIHSSGRSDSSSSSAAAPSDFANSAHAPSDAQQSGEPIEFDRMGVDREDSLTPHREELSFPPDTTATELLAALIPLLPARKSTCWVVRSRQRGAEAISNILGCVLCDEGLNIKPVSFVGEATVGELKIDKVVGIFRTGKAFRLGTPEEQEAMMAAQE